MKLVVTINPIEGNEIRVGNMLTLLSTNLLAKFKNTDFGVSIRIMIYNYAREPIKNYDTLFSNNVTDNHRNNS
jgi:hypothetical protein